MKSFLLPRGAMALDWGAITVNNRDNLLKTIAENAPSKGFAQAFGVQWIAGEEQAIRAVEQALESHENGTNFSQKLELEFLQRLVGEKQSNQAIEFGGISESKQAVGLIVVAPKPAEANSALPRISKSIHFKPKRNVLAENLRKNAKALQHHYGVTDRELEALKDLGSRTKALQAAVLEKVVLVSLEE